MSDLFENVEGKIIVTTSTGWKVECLPFGDDLMRAGSAIIPPEKPDPPTYLIGEGEDAIRVPYTEDSIKDETTPPEDTEAWGEYLLLLRDYRREEIVSQAHQSLARSRVMVHRATVIHDLPDLKAWAKEREEFYYITAPTDERELLFQFYTTEVAKTEDDVLKLMAGIMRATGVSEEVLDQFEDNFRDTLGTPTGRDTEKDPEEAPAEEKTGA